MSEFLPGNGVFRDLPFYVDLLCAHIYAGYINDTGGQYLQADFCGGGRPTRWRTPAGCSGLDAVDSETGRTRLNSFDGEAYVPGEPRRLASS